MIKKYWPFILILIVTLIFFFKILANGEYPYPGDLLVSFNYPWYSGGWSGYDPWTTHKEFIAMDSIREHLPWHHLTFTELRNNLSLPLWNPYNFSGFPQLGNMQTFIFNPFNILFLFLPIFEAWILFIIVQVPLTIFFTYLFARSLKLEKIPSLLAGLAFVFSSYFLNWIEIGIVGHSILWTPLILFSLQKLLDEKKRRYLILLILSSSAAIFAGHIQTAIFIFFISFAFAILKIKTSPKLKFKESLFTFFLLFFIVGLITAIQTLPALELYINSPLSKPLSKHIFMLNTMPFKNLITLFVPDFFGNPSTNNFWSVLYGDGTPNIGVLPLLFTIYAVVKLRNWQVNFFATLAIVFLLYATKSPLFLLIQKFDIPFLTGTAAARSMFIFCFALSILSAYGLNDFLKHRNYKTLIRFIGSFSAIYLLILLSTQFLPTLLKDPELISNLTVAKRNTYLPFLIITLFTLSLTFSAILGNRLKILSHVWLIALFTLTIFGGVYQFNKNQPFAPKKFFFPKHPVFSWLQANAGIYRYEGEDTAKTWNNIPAYFNLYSAGGYGVFRINRYAELFAAQEKGYVPEYYERSTAEFSELNTDRKKRLYNLLGIKYLTFKNESQSDTKSDWPKDDIEPVYKDGIFRIFERSKVMPRFWLTGDYIVTNNDQEIIEKIFDSNFDLKTIILEKEPALNIQSANSAKATLINYSPNNLNFALDAPENALFFISDTYFPGWNAYIDGEKTEILRADYSFRAVPIPSKSSKLEFRYEPLSVKAGMIFTLIGLIVLAAIFLDVKRRGDL